MEWKTVYDFRNEHGEGYYLEEIRFLFWDVVRWIAPDDGGVDFYAFGKPCGQTFIHRWMMR